MGNFSYGVTQKLDLADREGIRDKIKKEQYKKKTAGMGRLRKALYDLANMNFVEQI